jgi:hypothetical protein
MRGRPPKSRHQLRRDHALAQLANIDVWLMVQSKLKAVPVSVERACQLIAEEARLWRSHARKNSDQAEAVIKKQKYLFSARTLRRRYDYAEALRREDRHVAEFCARELARLRPWATTTGRRRVKESCAK